MDAVSDFFADPDRQAQLIRTGVALVVTVVLWVLVVRGGGRLARGFGHGDDIEAAERRQRAETLWKGVRRVVAIVFVLVVLLTLMNIWDIPTTPFIAIGSAVGVAVGFGAQSLVKDVIAGFFILAENQFSIGDVVRIADASGTVEEMRLRVTKLRDLDGNTHYVPNGAITVASNFTQAFAQVVVDIGVAYQVDVDRALRVFEDELNRFASDEAWAPHVIEEPVVLGVQELADSAVILRGYLRVAPDQRWAVRREFLRRVKNRFDSETIEIPFPHQTVYVGNPEALRSS